MTVLYCQETPELKLGPGTKVGDEDVLVFIDGYAEIDLDDPFYEVKMSWVKHPGTPYIRVLGEDEAQANLPGAVFCPECDKAFATDKQLNGHLISHKRQRG